jgi:hypothetical protein
MTAWFVRGARESITWRSRYGSARRSENVFDILKA